MFTKRVNIGMSLLAWNKNSPLNGITITFRQKKKGSGHSVEENGHAGSVARQKRPIIIDIFEKGVTVKNASNYLFPRKKFKVNFCPLTHRILAKTKNLILHFFGVTDDQRWNFFRLFKCIHQKKVESDL